MMALKAGELPGPQGQIELFRQYALGNFRNLLIEVAKDPAMLVWLDGRTNTRARPQENFGREIMELFTFGVGNYTEQDVYAAARVFTGWNLRAVATPGGANDPTTYYEFVYNANQHDTTAKTFTFGSTATTRRFRRALPPTGCRTASTSSRRWRGTRKRRGAWRASCGISLSPTSRRPTRVRRDDRRRVPPQQHRDEAGRQRTSSDRGWFLDPTSWYTRYSWPVEFVVRAIREVGWEGFSVDTARTPLTNMGQTLFEPPDVAGWELGRGWFSTGAMLARMNFAATLAANQKFNLARAAAPYRSTPENVLDFFLDRLSPSPFEHVPYTELHGVI